MHKTLTTLIVSGASVVALTLGAGAAAAGAAPAGSRTANACGVSQLSARVSLPAGGGTAGSLYADVTLTNDSRRGCIIGGYPGLGLEASDGRALAAHIDRVDRSDEHSTYLRPGQRALSVIRVIEVPSGENQRVVTPARVLVTPPNSYTSLQEKWTLGSIPADDTIDVEPLGYDG